jgi:hypothetical protein
MRQKNAASEFDRPDLLAAHVIRFAADRFADPRLDDIVDPLGCAACKLGLDPRDQLRGRAAVT